MDLIPTSILPLVGEERFVGFRPDKVPINARTGLNASVSHSGTWSTYHEAARWALDNGGHVGIVPGDHLVVLDLDGAAGGGEPGTYARELMALIGCDAAPSVSGSGVHLYPQLVWDNELSELLGRRKVFRDVPIEQLEFRTGKMGTILGHPVRWRSTKTPQEQTEAVKALLRSLHPGTEVTLFGGLFKGAKGRGLHRDYLTSLILRTADPQGKGWLSEEEAVAKLAGYYGHLKDPKAAARRRVKLLVGSPFATLRPNSHSGGFTVALRKHEAVAEEWGIGLGRRIRVEVAVLAALPPARVGYLVLASTRNGDASLPLPTSRSARRDMTGVSPTTQWRAERQANVEVTPNYRLLKEGEVIPEHRLGQAVETRFGFALRISNATHITMARSGCGHTGSRGPVQASHLRRYHRAGERVAIGVQDGLVFVGFGVVAGRRSGLWRVA